ncbi:hypothetical protein SDC9_92454 [bioreactor metagenome]|uniref:Uncharacterized protein n=1 Tax=bioreactor metagenome TaxID=1076179 RepID=A0A644ZY61_9ZZZZ
MFQLLLVYIMDGGLFYVYGSLDTPPTRFSHPTPVLKSLRNQGVWRNGGDGFIEIQDLNGRKVYFDDITVHAVLGHGYPVTDADHVVGRHLDTRHKAQNGILKNQQ